MFKCLVQKSETFSFKVKSSFTPKHKPDVSVILHPVMRNITCADSDFLSGICFSPKERRPEIKLQQ